MTMHAAAGIPAHANPLTRLESFDLPADRDDAANCLVSGHYRILRHTPIIIDDG
jgi:hypothetical protein